MNAQDAFRGLCEVISDSMQKLGIPGVAVGVISGDQEFSAGFGVTNVDHPLQVDADTLFQIGSTTKTFTGTAVMRLVEMGKFALDEPVRRYLPDFAVRDADASALVTIRHLLIHTAGWVGDFFDDTGNGDDALEVYVARMATLPQLTPLGTVWSYNNAAFSLAGRVIEAATGQTYEHAMLELVLKPLGLRRSYFMPADVMTHRFAVGHISLFGERARVLRPWPLPRSAAPAGAIAASTSDVLRYARFHLGDGAAVDGTRLLSPESMAAMQTPQVAAQLGTKMGLSWMIDDRDGVKIVSHGGATLGQMSTFILAPERRFALTMTTNSTTGSQLGRQVSEWVNPNFLGFERPIPTALKMLPGQLAEYAGCYTAALRDIEIKADKDELTMHVSPKGGFPTKDSPAPPTPPPSRAEFVGVDRIRLLDTPWEDETGEFLRNTDGAIAWFRFGFRIHARSPS
jgi:CubicO group peptidase (beta-lactamase class C family)